jgi:hypothetical protein
MTRVGRYNLQRIYVIICDDCNEDITRPLSGEDVTTRTEADAAMADHDLAYHSATTEG